MTALHDYVTIPPFGHSLGAVPPPLLFLARHSSCKHGYVLARSLNLKEGELDVPVMQSSDAACGGKTDGWGVRACAAALTVGKDLCALSIFGKCEESSDILSALHFGTNFAFNLALISD